MKRLKSKRINREYWVHETRFEPCDGLPCFNLTEVGLLKSLDIPDELLTQIFDAKAELGVTLMELIPTKKEPAPVPYSPEKRKEQAARWASSIAETIRNTKVRS